MRSSAVLPLLSAIVALGACQSQEIQAQLLANTNGLSMASEGGSAAAGQVHQELSRAMDTVNANLAAGMNSWMKLVADFVVDTGPDMVHLYSLVKNCPLPREMATFAKDMWGQGAVKMAQLMGNGAVTGSNVAKGAMEWSGNALNGVNQAVDKAAKIGIDMAYKMTDAAMDLEMKKMEVLSGALMEVGKALQDASPRMKAVADKFQAALKTVEDKINKNIEDVKQMMAKVISDGVKLMEDGRLRFQTEGQAYFYNVMDSYKNSLEKMYDNLKTISNKINVMKPNTGTGNSAESAATMGSYSVSDVNDYLSTKDILSAAVDTETAGGLNVGDHVRHMLSTAGGLNMADQAHTMLSTAGGLNVADQAHNMLSTVGGLNMADQAHTMLSTAGGLNVADQAHRMLSTAGGLNMADQAHTMLSTAGGLNVADQAHHMLSTAGGLNVADQDHTMLSTAGGLNVADQVRQVMSPAIDVQVPPILSSAAGDLSMDVQVPPNSLSTAGDLNLNIQLPETIMM